MQHGRSSQVDGLSENVDREKLVGTDDMLKEKHFMNQKQKVEAIKKFDQIPF